MVAPLPLIIGPEVVDITQVMLDLGASVDQRLPILGFVDYQDLVARALFGETMIHKTESEKGPPDADFDLSMPSPSSSTSQSLPRPVPYEDDGTEGTEGTEYDAQNHGVSTAESISDVPQRSLSLNGLVLTLPAGLGEEIRCSKSTTGLRRRARGSVYGVFKTGGKDS